MNVDAIIGGLVSIGNRMAERLSLPPVKQSSLRRKIKELLIDRDNYEIAMKGIITKDELANLILAHLQQFLCNEAGVKEPSELPNYIDLHRKIIEVVFV